MDRYAELKGVWRYVGSQQPESAYIATENDTLPDCASEDGEYSYGGLDTTADQVGTSPSVREQLDR